MADEPEQTSLFDSDDVELEVTDDPQNDTRTIVTGATISASEKVSTGDYENYNPHQTLHVQFRPAFDVTTLDGLDHLRSQVKGLHAEVQRNLSDAVDRRLSDPSFREEDAFQQMMDDVGGGDA